MATEEQVFSLPWPDTSDPGPQVGDGRKYTDGEWRDVWRTAFLGAKPAGAGVFNVPDDAEVDRLEVTSPGANQISVATGAACVDGLFVPVDTTVGLTPASAGAGSTRQDRVVLRATWGAGAGQYTTVVAVKQGTQAAPPDLTQIHNSTWEISLARYTINDVGAISGLTDERVYAQSVMRHEYEAHTAAFAAHQAAATLDHPNNSVTNAKLRDSTAVSIIGRAANSAGDPADIAAAANDTFLQRVGNVLQWGLLTLAMIPDLLITEAKLAAAVAAKLVTNGNSHDHVGGDGAQINHTGLSNIGANTHAQIDGHIGATSAHSATSAATASRIMMRDASGRAQVAAPSASADIARKDTVDAVSSALTTHKSSSDHDGRYYTESESNAQFAPIAKGVTNGDSHDHAGGDGAQIPLAGHANDSVDDTKVGNRVPQFRKRQGIAGGEGMSWSEPGQTNYTLGALRMQCGSALVTIADGAYFGTVTVTFPEAYRFVPLVLPAIWHNAPGDGGYVPSIFAVAVSGVTLCVARSNNWGLKNVSVHWLAIGPE